MLLCSPSSPGHQWHSDLRLTWRLNACRNQALSVQSCLSAANTAADLRAECCQFVCTKPHYNISLSLPMLIQTCFELKTLSKFLKLHNFFFLFKYKGLQLEPCWGMAICSVVKELLRSLLNLALCAAPKNFENRILPLFWPNFWEKSSLNKQPLKSRSCQLNFNLRIP